MGWTEEMDKNRRELKQIIASGEFNDIQESELKSLDKILQDYLWTLSPSEVASLKLEDS